MKFKLAKSHRYWWPVTVRMPDPETAGQVVEQQLKVQFEPLPRDEELRSNDAFAELKTLREMAEFEIANTRRIVRNWDGVVDGDGEAVPFGEEVLGQALQFEWFRTAIVKAYRASMSGEEARLGN